MLQLPYNKLYNKNILILVALIPTKPNQVCQSNNTCIIHLFSSNHSPQLIVHKLILNLYLNFKKTQTGSRPELKEGLLPMSNTIYGGNTPKIRREASARRSRNKVTLVARGEKEQQQQRQHPVVTAEATPATASHRGLKREKQQVLHTLITKSKRTGEEKFE